MRKHLILAGLVGLMALIAPDAWAQSVNFDFGQGGSMTGRIVQLFALVTVLSLAPSILIVFTSFTRMVVVLSLLRSAMGTNQTPPNVVMISLALFLTGFVMMPTFTQAYDNGIKPLIEEQINEEVAFTKTMEPFRAFMQKNARQKDIKLFVDMAKVKVVTPSDIPLTALIPAFIISELRRSFEIGFLLFIPFIVIDMVVASVLMSMGMMMLPPVQIALPFKLIFFVLVDGWNLVSASLVQSFNVPPGG